MSASLIDIATVVRSKNSGPFEMTLDIIFNSPEIYNEVKLSQAIDSGLISRLYGVSEADRIKIIAFDPASAIKITFPRRIASGNIGDTDIYGAQQHAPLLSLQIEGVSFIG
ncbi:hypothetical protein L905_07135 [Agrobacterium sp. TS43]|uniref:DUF4387 domain-containing protein n=1 Tax=Agrobacterium TaxID=357 RepID=UPI0003764CF0|nr:MULTISPECIES: DUF4387 domain-containing protein [Agrobacterium]EPR21263.1 hypothetical protein L902_01980 [Agrobacterium radiobacter DSM 30147]KDR88552.1 hypothetical protein K538_15745 [Agrobacterium tumefaciens GW4]KVK49922.1 hypothetical protein L903_18790 [Agrobacterium sp. JL28]KVK50214.1 hypothetical protein L904_18790 [Agrobacterium sp. LY4]KVK54249.1 hypothetical protein L901_17930 [Agrobacterium sp. D14]